MRSPRNVTAIALALLALGCRDDPRRLITDPPLSPAPVYLTVSGEDLRPGSTATVTAHVVVASGVKAIGSFAAHLRYDPAGLAFVAESRLPTGLRAFNPRPGHIRVAGAAVEGFADGQ